MFEEKIKKIMSAKKLTPVDVYAPLRINRVNFYKALKTSNINNKSFQKILRFLDVEVTVGLTHKKHEHKK